MDGRDKYGRYSTKMKPQDHEDIKALLKSGKSIRAIKVAIMQARDVSEPTAMRWIRQVSAETTDKGVNKDGQ